MELGGVAQLRHLLVRYGCLHGVLPQVWRFKHLSTLMITGFTENSTTRELPSDCGITGTIPLAWPTQRQLPQLRYLYMPNNKLSGPLHPSYGTWRTVVAVWLEKTC